MGVGDSRSFRYDIYVRVHHFVRRPTSIPFRRFWGNVRREFMQRLFDALNSALGSYLRDAHQDGSVDALACFPFRHEAFSSLLLFTWCFLLPFLVKTFELFNSCVGIKGGTVTYLDLASTARRYRCRTCKKRRHLVFWCFALLSRDFSCTFFLAGSFDPRVTHMSALNVFRLAP
jgi:hypothetical protein